ncbi:MAG: YfhO family protein [Oscillospiraceae bacterium]
MALEKKRNHMLHVFLIGLGLSFLIFLPFLIFDKGLFVYYGDFDVQQIPFYKLSHEAIRSGQTMWNWTTDLGVNFIGSYSFYTLGSPFFWLTIPFPKEVVPYLMAPLLMLKFALTSVIGYAFINRFTKTSRIAMIGGLLYAFSGFNIYNIFFNHFNEVVMAFPLLLIAIEESVVNKKRGLFALAVAFCAMINYYFFFGEVIFCLIYFFVRLRSDDFNIDFKRFMLLFFEAVLGLLLAMILLLPSLMALMGNPRTSDTIEGFNTLIYGDPQRYGLILSSFFFPPDIPARPNFFPDANAKWSSVSMFLPLFSMTGVIAFLKAKSKHFAKTIIIISIIICFVPFLNASFSAFNYAYYARWFYMPLLMMSLATCIALEDHLEEFSFALKVTGGFVAFFALIGIMPKRVDDKLQWFSLPEYPDRFWTYVLVALFGLLCTWLLVIMTPKHKKFMKTVLCCFCAITFTFSAFMIFCGKQAGNKYEIVAEQGIFGADKISLDEDEFYRIDTFDEMDNLGMFWEMPTINAFHSVVPASIIEYYELIGGERGVASRPKEDLIGVRALTNVKYSFIKEDKKDRTPMLGFSYYDTQNGYKIYENDYFVPMGVGFEYRIPKSVLDETTSNKDRLLLKGIYFDEKEYSDYISVLPTLPKEQIQYDALVTDDSYIASCEILAQNTVSDFTYSSSGFTANYTANKDSFVFFSVPFDKGFSAKVNSIDAEIIKANGGFMAVKVTSGENAIEFSYKTPGLALGSLISLFALLILISYLILSYFDRKKNPEKFINYEEIPCSVDMLYIEENEKLIN